MNSLQNFVALLVRHRRMVIWDVVLVTLAVMVYSLVMPPTFTANAQILPPSEETDLFSLPSIISTSNLSRMVRLGGSLRGATPSDVIAAILTSRTIGERVMDSCDYFTVSRIKPGHWETALRNLRDHTRVSVGDEGIVALSVDARTPQYAARLANAYLTELDRFLRESNMSQGKAMRIFAQQRLLQNDTELAVAQESLTAFQKRNRTASVDDETKTAIQTYAKLQADKAQLEFQLNVAQQAGATDNPYVQSLQQRTEEYQRQLAQYETGGATGYGVGLSVPFRALPDIAARYARLLADYQTKQEVRVVLQQQYEQARMTEVRDTPFITILDPPRVPERRSAPKRAKMTLIAFVLSLIVGVILAFIAETWDRQKQDPQTWRGWQAIAHDLRSRRQTPSTP